MLAHLEERPLNMQRFPNGADGPSFWQKDIPATAPSWLRRWKEVGVEEREANEHLVADRVASLCWLGNQASFEVHAWTSRLDDPMTPTFALIDIDPGTKTTWDETLTLARLYRTALGHLGVRGYPKTTGKRGIQVWIPIEPEVHVPGDERLGRAAVAGGRVDRSGSRVVGVGEEPSRRQGPPRLHAEHVHQDPRRAVRVRPADGAPVSTPITWDELDDPDLRSDRWTIRTVVDRVAKVGDLFAAGADRPAGAAAALTDPSGTTSAKKRSTLATRPSASRGGKASARWSTPRAAKARISAATSAGRRASCRTTARPRRARRGRGPTAAASAARRLRRRRG